MSADDHLRLAWQAHRDGREGRRDALLTLAAALAEPSGEPWVGAVRDFLVASRPDHLFARFYHLDEALGDRRVAAALRRLRETFPPARVRSLARRAEVARGPHTGRSVPIATVLADLLAPARDRPKARLGSATRLIPPRPEPVAADPPAPRLDPIVDFYLNVLLGVAVLCAAVVEESRDGKRAA